MVVQALDASLIVILVHDSNYMGVSLVFAAVSTLIDPFAIVLAQPIEVDPQGASSVSNHTLWSIDIN